MKNTMPKRVLAIEDNVSNMILISRVVEAEGYELLQAEDGVSALDLLAKEKPDLILNANHSSFYANR